MQVKREEVSEETSPSKFRAEPWAWVWPGAASDSPKHPNGYGVPAQLGQHPMQARRGRHGGSAEGTFVVCSPEPPPLIPAARAGARAAWGSRVIPCRALSLLPHCRVSVGLGGGGAQDSGLSQSDGSGCSDGSKVSM